MTERLCVHCKRQPATLYSGSVCQPCSFTVDSVVLLESVGAALNKQEHVIAEALLRTDKLLEKIEEIGDKLDDLHRGRFDL